MNLVDRGIFTLLLVQSVLSSHYSSVEIENPDYLIISPQVYHPGTTAKLGVDLFGKKPCDVVVKLYNSARVISSVKGNITPGKHGELELQIPDKLPLKARNLKIEGVVCGNKTKKKTIRVQRLKDNLFIQTDKPIYKPGQKIRMRIISICHELKPVGNEVSSVTVQEPLGSRVMQWNNVKLHCGIASLELPLSKEPVLGDWKIKAVVGKTSTTQTIEVAKYVLPKFEVVVKPPPYMALDQREFRTSICARYTYGKPVKGKLTAVLCFKHDEYEKRTWRYITKSNCHNITRELDGCTEITLTRYDLKISSMTRLWSARFHIDASVIETLTGIKLNSKRQSVRMIRRSTRLDFSHTSDQFKPGLPFKYTLKVIRPDDSPVTGAKVQVMITRGLFYFGGKHLFYNKTFIVKNGIITQEIKSLAHNAKSLNFQAKLLDKFPFKMATKVYPVTGHHTTRAWYSPSLSYLQVSTTQNIPTKVDSDGSITVRYTVRNDTGKNVDFYYNIMCKGNIVYSGIHTQNHPYVQELTPVLSSKENLTLNSTASNENLTLNFSLNENLTLNKNENLTLNSSLNENLTLNSSLKLNVTIIKTIIRPFPWHFPTPPPLKVLPKPVVEQFDIKFPVTIKMVPRCRVLVYYVRADKETVADSIGYDVEDVLENQVSVSFLDDERKPGEKTRLILKAMPGSCVAYAAVDMSVHLLRAGNELTKDKIIDKLHKLDSGRSWNNDDRCKSGYRRESWRGKRSIMPFPWGGNYEDASEAFNDAGVVFLTNLNIFTKPCEPYLPQPLFRSIMLRNGGLRSGEDNIVTKTNHVKKPTEKKPVRIRKEFPETWLWAEEKLDLTSGEKTVEVTVPDTITTWIVTGFATSSTAGIGVSEKATLKTFQPFFVDITLPFSIIRGEEIPIIVTVFNYMSSCIPIRVELIRKPAEYKVTSYYINKLCVCGDAGQSVKFTIVGKKLGYIPLTVKAETSEANLCPNATMTAADAVTRKLLVEPEGIKQEYTKGSFFCTNGGDYKEEFDLHLPENIVSESVYPSISIIGDVMGPALSNLDGLLQMPYGCGEQNMAKFAPNIYIMDYLTETNQVNKEVKDKAETFMRSGYQRELTYKRKNGSYSAFGNSDKEGSMMLTAFVVRSFARARNYIFVDDKEIGHSLAWFARKQLKSGCFPNYGRVFSRRLQGGLNSELTITAYVTIALLEAGQKAKSPMVAKALVCIVNQTDSIKDSYTTALVAYTLTLANHSKSVDMIEAVRSKAITKGDQTYWSVSSDQTAPTTPPPYWWYYRTPSADVEMTGYALLAILKHSGLTKSGEVISIIRWLSKQRNAFGGFSSTQDTCVALQALSVFAGLAYGDNADDFRRNNLTGTLQINNSFSHDFTIDDHNRLVLQRVEIPGKLIPNKLQVTAKGAGCALLQTSVKYNIPYPKEIPAFYVAVDVRERRSTPDEKITLCSPLRLAISTKWLKDDVSNMAVVDVKLVSGFTVREESLEILKNNALLNFKRYDIEGQNVMLYFDEIKDISFSIDILQSTLMKKLKPAVVRVYDYYDPESEGKVMYNIHDKDCYGDKLETTCPRCLTTDNFEHLVDANADCYSYISKVKSTKGMLKISKSFMKGKTVSQLKTTKGMIKIPKSFMKGKTKPKIIRRFHLNIPEYCPCEEIYNDERSLVMDKSNFLKTYGSETIFELGPNTTILAWKGNVMKKKVKEIKMKCKLGQL